MTTSSGGAWQWDALDWLDWLISFPGGESSAGARSSLEQSKVARAARSAAAYGEIDKAVVRGEITQEDAALMRSLLADRVSLNATFGEGEIQITPDQLGVLREILADAPNLGEVLVTASESGWAAPSDVLHLQELLLVDDAAFDEMSGQAGEQITPNQSRLLVYLLVCADTSRAPTDEDTALVHVLLAGDGIFDPSRLLL